MSTQQIGHDEEEEEPQNTPAGQILTPMNPNKEGDSAGDPSDGHRDVPESPTE
jgi:hypothetical protein